MLDNAESILDPRGTDALEVYAMVEELSRLQNVWLLITSRIFAIPSDCRTLDIPTLSIEATRVAFYHIYKDDARANLVDKANSILIHSRLPYLLRSHTTTSGMWIDQPGNGRHDERRCCRLSTTRAWQPRSNFPLPLLCSKSSAPTPERFLESSLSSRKVPTRATSTGCSPQFPTEKVSLTNSVYFS